MIKKRSRKPASFFVIVTRKMHALVQMHLMVGN